ncbi:cytochrome b [Paraglaciecola aquimarina]|uniref:Cytochrome b n=1 Tax=Paraglaciecola algarum TaxID=3050085 RepID=A0ABS9D847_9ALTE|nr:cytochrome b [Paraglaciecola sp. G1-23]MCF2947831.1 cytochrome b [Paraglaciecola sp. G1-23]
MPLDPKYKDNPNSYGYISVINHWLIAVLVIVMLFLGLSLEFADLGSQKRNMLSLHKSLGAIVLILGTWRVLWRVFNGFPARNFAIKHWQQNAAKFTHILLLLSLIIMPLSGYVMTEAAGRPVNVFMLFSLPPIPDSRYLKEVAELIHSICAYSICGLLIAHIGGALCHQIVDKKPILKRMLFK